MSESNPLVLRDNYGRAVSYLRVSVTDRCNLRCFYCLPREYGRCGSHESLSLEQVAGIIRVGVSLGIHKVRITGGEPLVRPGVVDLIRVLGVMPGLTDLALSTNGTLLATHAEALRAAGLHRVNISIDSLRPAVFRAVSGRDDLPRVIEGIHAAREAGLSPIKLNVVVMRGVNDDQLTELLEFGISAGAQVRFIEYMPLGRGQRWEESYVARNEILERIRSFLAPQEARRQPGEAATYYPLLGGGEVGVISPVSCRFCDLCNRLRLTCDGKLRPCLTSEGEVDLLPALQPRFDTPALIERFRAATAARPQRGSYTDTTAPDRRSMAAIGG